MNSVNWHFVNDINNHADSFNEISKCSVSEGLIWDNRLGESGRGRTWKKVGRDLQPETI